MIQANNLRIGNLVSEKVLGVCKVWGMDNISAGLDNGDETEIYSINYANIDPIPLTPEILEKAGFVYGKSQGISSFNEDGSDPEGITHYWDFDIKRTDRIDGHNISIVKWGEQEYFTFQLERGFYRQEIRYIHQLQNLIYCLSGTELIINF